MCKNAKPGDKDSSLSQTEEWPEFQPDQNILEPGQQGGCSICDHHCTSEVSLSP